MNKDNFADKLLHKILNIDLVLMVVDMTVIPWTGDASIAAHHSHYSRFVNYYFVYLPFLIILLIAGIINCFINFIMKRKMKREVSENFTDTLYCFGVIIWGIYLIAILLLKLFYSDFQSIINVIIGL